jgi:putative heme-binding domain-containing protein
MRTLSGILGMLLLGVVVQDRRPWSTSRLTGSPEPPPPYRLERVFPRLRFDHPLEIVRALDRFFVIEHRDAHLGRILSFPDDPSSAQADLFLDLPGEIQGWDKVPDCKGVGPAYSLAFHPRFRENRYCYVSYVLEHREKGKQLPRGSRVSRFTVTRTDPPRADPRSEVVLLEWLGDGHNGGCLRFGPDGRLYISTGDGSTPNPPDALDTGQDIGDLLGSILRIDVDRTTKDLAYSVPRDNPFVDTRGARPEIWAYGLRNPWKMSFDPATGNLWVGDVGWERWEMLYRVVPGGNYGWSIMEGPNAIRPGAKRGPTPILPPAMAIEHPEAASITAGYVYHGKRLPELSGRYLFADFEMFHVFSARCEEDRLWDRRELARTEERVVGFAEDKDGELLLLDYAGGGLHRLVPNERARANPDFPTRLSQTGLFSSVAAGTPAPGVYPYAIHAEQWLDQATGERLVALPGTSRVTLQNNRFQLPKDAVLAKTLSRDGRRMETQILHFDGKDWQGYSYAWNEDQTDAVLVPPAGREDPRWTFPSRAACAQCHTVSWARDLLSFTPSQLGRTDLRDLGVVLPETPRLSDPRDPRAKLDARARSYLHVNCSVCHRLGGGSSALLELRADVPLENSFALGVRPALGSFGIADAYVIAGGDPSRSVLYYRMATLGHGRMPHVGSRRVDEEGLALVARWIDSLPPTPGAGAGAGERELLAKLRGGSSDGPLDRLLSTTSGALQLLRSMDELPESLRREAIRRAAAHPEESVRGLFERFVPEDERPKRLGTRVDPSRILSLKGDPERGRRLFFEGAGLQCRSCHAIAGRGESYGPDLNRIGAKGREKILESILEPSKEIDAAYVTYVLETQSGAIYSGLVAAKSEDAIVLKDADRKDHRIPRASIKRTVAQKISAMPESLLQSLTAQEAADLVDFLASLR